VDVWKISLLAPRLRSVKQFKHQGDIGKDVFWRRRSPAVAVLQPQGSVGRTQAVRERGLGRGVLLRWRNQRSPPEAQKHCQKRSREVLDFSGTSLFVNVSFLKLR